MLQLFLSLHDMILCWNPCSTTRDTAPHTPDLCGHVLQYDAQGRPKPVRTGAARLVAKGLGLLWGVVKACLGMLAPRTLSSAVFSLLSLGFMGEQCTYMYT